jgi:DNA uptake protein ComE-like DNA-binding protein
MAARIIAARPFKSADDLKKVSGIGDKKYAQIRPYFE